MRDRLLLDAGEEALTRLRSAVEDGDPAFAPLGEVLFWWCNLDDLLLRGSGYQQRREADPDGATLVAMRYARNAVTHGHQVTRLAEIYPGAELGKLVLGRSMLGTATGLRWLSRPEIGHTPDEPKPAQEDAYDRRLARAYLMPPLERAQRFLHREVP